LLTSRSAMSHLSFTRAEELARAAHAGQTGPDGCPFIEHPLRVADAVASWTGDTTAAVIALLHDAVEKGGTTWPDLRAAGVTEAMIAVLDALTKRPGEDVSAYLARCRANPVARDVKRHDLLDKLRPDYLAQLPKAEAERVATTTRSKLADLDGPPAPSVGAVLLPR
jgi:HD domain